MKVGDLVRWTHPSAEDIGLVVDYSPCGSEVLIEWTVEAEAYGYYPTKHENLEIIMEAV